MSMAASAREDLRAHQDAVSLPVAEVVSRLQDVLGATMVAYLGEVGDTWTVAQWVAGDREPGDAATSRLRMAYQAVALLGGQDGQEVVQAWFWGEHPQLDDMAPARVLREQPLEGAGPAVIAAARAFTTHGWPATATGGGGGLTWDRRSTWQIAPAGNRQYSIGNY